MGCMNQEEDNNVWPTFADIAFSILLIISLIMLAQYVVVGKFLELNRISREQNLLSEKLKETFPGEYGKDIKVIEEPQLQKITFSDKILFDSGRTEIKMQGQDILKKVGDILNQIKVRSLSSFDEIQIRGHTDDNPIVGKKLKAKFPTNWELSSARATAVVRFFVDNCEMKSSKDLLLSAQGFSQYDYVQNGDNDFARSLNRRIEIVIKYPLNNIKESTESSREITAPPQIPITVVPKSRENQTGARKKEEKQLERKSPLKEKTEISPSISIPAVKKAVPENPVKEEKQGKELIKLKEEEIKTIEKKGKTLKLLGLPRDLRSHYLEELRRVKVLKLKDGIKVAGQFNLIFSVNQSGQIKIQAFDDRRLRVSPGKEKANVKEMISRKICSISLPPPEDKQGMPVTLVDWTLTFEVGTFIGKIILNVVY